MSNYHPECACQQRPLNQDDLAELYAAGKYETINEAFAQRRFKFTDTKETN